MQKPEAQTISRLSENNHSVFGQISRTVHEPVPLTEKLETAFAIFYDILPFEKASVFLCRDKDEMKVLHAQGREPDACRILESGIRDFLPPHWSVMGQPFVLESASRKRAGLLPDAVGLTLKTNSRPLGLLVLEGPDIDIGSKTSSEALQLFGGMITSAVQTDRLQWENRLTAQKYQNFLEQADFPVFICSPEGMITEFNRAFLEMIGEADVSRVINTNLCGYIETDPGHDNVANLLNRYGYYRNLEVRIKTVRGQPVTVLLTLSPIGYHNKKHLGYQGILQDITERQELEEQLIQAQKIGVLGTLASGIAHDFNNLIGGIMGCASLILTDMEESNTHYDDIQTILKASKKAGELAEQLLTFSRRDKVQIKPLNINDTIRDVLKLLARTIDKSIQIKTELCPDTAIIEANATRIQQAMLNICINARDAMPEGGQLAVQSDNIILSEQDLDGEPRLKPGLYVHVQIRDTGCGMDEDTLENIFKPFYTTKADRDGHGLGLSIAAEVAKTHQGKITVQSRSGEGTVFQLYFPASLTHNRSIGDMIEETSMPCGDETLMLVDDEEIIRRMGKRMLERFGYRVLVASTGDEAVRFFDESNVDLVILDMVMPEMNGWETLSKIREIDPHVKALLTSGHNQEQIPPEQHVEGFNGYIHKPFMTGQMLRLIRQTLDAPVPQ